MRKKNFESIWPNVISNKELFEKSDLEFGTAGETDNETKMELDWPHSSEAVLRHYKTVTDMS